jgi:hypothetical protein
MPCPWTAETFSTFEASVRRAAAGRGVLFTGAFRSGPVSEVTDLGLPPRPGRGDFSRRETSARGFTSILNRVLRPIVVLAVLAARALPASAQECPEPPLRGPQAVAPGSGAVGVTLDAPIVLSYSAGYFGPDGPGEDPRTLVRLEECGDCSGACALGEGVPVPGEVEVHGDRLLFVPEGALADGTRYVGSAAGSETSLFFEFCTGRSVDAGPPRLAGLPRPSSTRVGPQCGLPDGGYRLAISFPPASDDGPPGSIEYLLYLSRGAGVEAPRVVARSYNYAAREIALGVLLSGEQTRAPICLTLAAVDGVGNAAVDPTPQCFDALTRTTFAGKACRAAPGSRGQSALGIAAAALAVLLGRRAARARWLA